MQQIQDMRYFYQAAKLLFHHQKQQIKLNLHGDEADEGDEGAGVREHARLGFRRWKRINKIISECGVANHDILFGLTAQDIGVELIVKNIPLYVSKDDFIEYCAYGGRLVLQVRKTINRPYAFVTYKTEEAYEAMKYLDNSVWDGLKLTCELVAERNPGARSVQSDPQDVSFDAGLTDFVSWPVLEARLPDGVDVFVGHIAPNTSEEELRSLFETIGEVTQVRYMMVTGKKAYANAIVTYRTKELASKAIASLNGTQLNGISVRVEIAKK